MFYLDTFFHRITSDFRQKELLPLKLLFFVHASTLYVLYPYLTIHMRELGINVEEAAIMSAVTPIVAIIMPPLAGVAADRIGNFKFILALCSVLGGAASLLLLLIPVGRITFTYPDRSILSLSCPTNAEGMLSLSLAEQHPCVMLPSVLNSQINNESLQIDSQLEACGLICTRHPSEFVPEVGKGPQTIEAESAAILRTRNYTVAVTDAYSNISDQFMYTLQADDLPLYRAQTAEDLDERNFRLMKNKKHFQTSVRQLTDMTYFFPTSGLYNLTCEMTEIENLTDIYVCNILKTSGEFIPSVINRAKAQSFSIRVKSEPGRHPDSIKTLYVTEINPIEDNSIANNGYIDTTCGYDNSSSSLAVLVPLLNPENSLEMDSLLDMTDCKPSCIVTVPRAKLCSNLETTVEYDIRLTFWLYLVVRVFIGMISGTAFAMFEGGLFCVWFTGAVIAILREHKADYGLQRIYAAIGGMLSSPLSGMLIDYASEGKGYTDFRPAFYLYAGLKIVSGMLMLTINLEFKSPATNVVDDVLSVLRNIEIVALFITCFILGTAWGYIESFLFWLLQDLGASRSLMGITITIGGIAGLPLLVMSGPIIDRIGHANVLFIGFIFYSIRLLGYSLIYNPWMCLIFEAMESVTSSLAITAAVTYAAKLSTNTTDSSIQGLLGGLYFGVGKGAGSLVGGYLMKSVGTRPTYQIFSGVMFVTGILYYIFNHIYIASRHITGNDSQSQEKKLPSDCINSVAFEKQKEAEVVNICQNNINTKVGNHIIENIPLKSAVTSIKNYSANEKNKNKKGMSNNTNCDKVVDPGGSAKINLGFEEEEGKPSNLRNKLCTQADDTRSQEKR